MFFGEYGLDMTHSAWIFQHGFEYVCVGGVPRVNIYLRYVTTCAVKIIIHYDSIVG